MFRVTLSRNGDAWWRPAHLLALLTSPCSRSLARPHGPTAAWCRAPGEHFTPSLAACGAAGGPGPSWQRWQRAGSAERFNLSCFLLPRSHMRGDSTVRAFETGGAKEHWCPHFPSSLLMYHCQDEKGRLKSFWKNGWLLKTFYKGGRMGKKIELGRG